MKNLLSLIVLILALSSCGGGKEESVSDLISRGDLAAIRAKKTELSQQHRELSGQMSLLDSAIAELDQDENLPLVSTIAVKKEPFNHYLELQGEVTTRQNVLISPEMSGTLLRVYVKEGQQVQKGQLLASIDDGGLENQLQQLKTQAELAKTTYERQKRLWDQNIGSEIQYLQAKTNYEAQENTVKQMESQVSKSFIRAPFTGVIDDVIKDQGTVVNPGQGSEIFRIVNLSDMYIEVEVPERYLGSVSSGKEVKVVFPVLGDSLQTRIRTTGNFINPNNRSFTAEIPVPNKGGAIKPNLTARVRINDYTNKEAILIPQSIISENAEGEQYAYVVVEDEEGEGLVARRTIITTGLSQGNLMEVLQGIEDGQQVIREGARTVKDGQKVEILNQ